MGRKYKYEDFDLGDEVFHKTNRKLMMIIIRKDDSTKNMVCRWVDSLGSKQEEEFLFAELIKADDHYRDMSPRITTSIP